MFVERQTAVFQCNQRHGSERPACCQCRPCYRCPDIPYVVDKWRREHLGEEIPDGHERDSIEAHLTIVFAALAVSRWTEAQTGRSNRKFVKTARCYRTIEIQAGRQTITAADPLPDDLRQTLDAINYDN